MRRALAIAGAWAVSLVLAGAAGWAMHKPPVHEVTKAEHHQEETREAAAVEDTTRHTAERRKTTTTTTRPTKAGPVVIVKVEELDRTTDAQGERREVEATRAVVETRTETERSAAALPGWRVSATAGWRLHPAPSDLTPQLYGAAVSRRLFGPFWVGAWGDTDKRAGLSLAVEW